jgi:hypothetical protein
MFLPFFGFLIRGCKGTKSREQTQIYLQYAEAQVSSDEVKGMDFSAASKN